MPSHKHVRKAKVEYHRLVLRELSNYVLHTHQAMSKIQYVYIYIFIRYVCIIVSAYIDLSVYVDS